MEIENIATETEVPVADEAEVLETAESPEEQPQQEGAKQEEDVPFPKKAVNALSRRDKKIGKLSAEVEQLRSQLQQYTAAQTQATQSKQSDAEPNMGDYATLADYVKAMTKWETQQALNQDKQKFQEHTIRQQEAAVLSKRADLFDAKIAEYEAKLPDFNDLSEEHEDLIGTFSPGVTRAILKADDGPLGLYVLAKEGKLESLANMSPNQVEAVLAKAETRGAAYLQKISKPSKAPPPIKAVKGTGISPQSSLDKMPPKERLAWLKG